MNILIGKKLIRTSKNFFIFYIIGIATFAAFVGVGFYLSREYIAFYYASNNLEMSRILVQLLTIYSFCIPSELSLTSTFIGVKTIGSIFFLTILNILLFVGLNTASSYYLSQKLHLGAVYLFANMNIIFYVENIICFIKVSCTDWTNRNLDVDEEDIAVLSREGLTPMKTPTKRIRGTYLRADSNKARTSNLVLY